MTDRVGPIGDLQTLALSQKSPTVFTGELYVGDDGFGDLDASIIMYEGESVWTYQLAQGVNDDGDGHVDSETRAWDKAATFDDAFAALKAACAAHGAELTRSQP